MRKTIVLTVIFVLLCVTFASCKPPEVAAPPQGTTEAPSATKTVKDKEADTAPVATPAATPETTPETTPRIRPSAPPTETPYVPEPGENMGTEYTFSPYHPFICNYIVVGGSYNGDWLSAQSAATMINGTELYTLYGTEGVIGNGFGGRVMTEDEFYGGPYTECIEDWELKVFDAEDLPPEYRSFPYGVDGNENSPFFVAVCDEWDAMPRTAEALSLKNDTYEQVVKDVLAENGLKVSKVDLIQCYRVDFEGDGVDEVVIVAESPTDYWRYEVSDGAYSVVVLRKIVNGKVENFTLHVDVHTDDENDNETQSYYGLRAIEQVCGFYDLNGDEKLELVTEWSYYEGYYYCVYEVFPDGPVNILTNGWGA